MRIKSKELKDTSYYRREQDKDCRQPQIEFQNHKDHTGPLEKQLAALKVRSWKTPNSPTKGEAL
jgi:hypothetical protein